MLFGELQGSIVTMLHSLPGCSCKHCKGSQACLTCYAFLVSIQQVLKHASPAIGSADQEHQTVHLEKDYSACRKAAGPQACLTCYAFLASLHGRLVSTQEYAVPVKHEGVEGVPMMLSFDAQVLYACTHLSNV